MAFVKTIVYFEDEKAEDIVIINTNMITSIEKSTIVDGAYYMSFADGEAYTVKDYGSIADISKAIGVDITTI